MYNLYMGPSPSKLCISEIKSRDVWNKEGKLIVQTLYYDPISFSELAKYKRKF